MTLRIPLLAVLLFCCGKESAPSKSQTSAPEAAETGAETGETSGGDLGYGDDARSYDSLVAAMEIVMADKPQVIGFGEFHKLHGSAPVQSALRRFAKVYDQLGPQTGHLVLETWSVDKACGAKGKAVTKAVVKTIERPPETESEMQVLIRKTNEFGVKGHLLTFSCDEYAKLLTEKGLDSEKLLVAVSGKLEGETKLALSQVAKDKLVLIYGGATHNNLYPYSGLEPWSYAQSIASQSKFIEVDLYVPEFVEGDKLLQNEAWYRLLKLASDKHVILIRRDENSYIIILRKGLAEAE